MKEHTYTPPSDANGGWRRIQGEDEVAKKLNLKTSVLDKALDVMQQETKNGGLFVVRHGWLAYERCFGLGHPNAKPNLASCGKSLTSIAMGIFMYEHPELFPEGLDTKVYTPEYLPSIAFPLNDPRKKDIRLGQLLAFTCGIRGQSPSYVHGQKVILDPIGPDGWPASTDEIALGLKDYMTRDGLTSATTLWCEPGQGYSYASAAIHIVSMILRRLSGMELEEFLRIHIAEPLEWGEWSYGYRHVALEHTLGGGGITLQASDMLRFGYLLLHEGRWGDKQVVPAEYVRLATHSSPYNPHYPYSLQFNVNTNGEWPEIPRDAFWKRGSGGHVLYVIPSLDMVAWKLGGRDGQYRREDTGFEPPIPVPDVKDWRAGWTQTLTTDEGTREILRLVVEAAK